MRKLRDKRLYWRGDRLWCRVPGPGGRIVRKATHCTDEAAAAARADELERRYANPRLAAASAATLEGSVKALIKDMKRRGRSDATVKIAEQKLGHFPRLWGKTLSMADIQAPLVLEYIDKRKGEDVTDFTIKKELSHLGQLLALAKYLGVYTHDPAEVLPPFFSGKHQPRKRRPSPAEVEAVLKQLDPWRAAHLAFIAGTGARRSEAARAHRSDVHLDEGFVHIRGTKTEAADDEVPISEISLPWVTAALAHAPGKDLLFRPWGNLTRDLNAACLRADVEVFTPNDLRRSFGSWHRDAGVPVELVSKLLRHTTDKLAQTVYARIGAAATGKLIGAALQAAGQQAAVSDLYLASDREGPSAPQLPAAEAPDAAKNEYFAGAAPGNRTPDLRFTKPRAERWSEGTKLGISRAARRRGVPDLYASAYTIPSPAVRAFRAQSWLWFMRGAA